MSSFFSRKEKNLIPPVDDHHSTSNGRGSVSPRPAFPTSNSSHSHTPSSRAGTGAGAAADGPNRFKDPYSRGERNLENDRSELFSGYDGSKHSGNRFKDPLPSQRNFQDDIPNTGDDEEDVEAIKTKTRFTKQESVNTSRNALRIAREAEETARNTLQRLGDQSEKIANTERHLDISKGHSNRAEDRTDELKQLNRSIFRPVVTFNKDAKRRMQEQKLSDRYEDEKNEREASMGDIRASQNRLGESGAYGSHHGENGDANELVTDGPGARRNRFRSAEQQATRKVERSRYQVDATASDDELEDEIDDNLDEIGEAAARLKKLGMAMGSELDTQNVRLERIDGKVGRLDMKITHNTERLKKIK